MNMCEWLKNIYDKLDWSLVLMKTWKQLNNPYNTENYILMGMDVWTAEKTI